jgi:arylformamidase
VHILVRKTTAVEPEDGMQMNDGSVDTYRGMGRAELDVAYNNRAVVPDWEGYLRRWRQRSATLYSRASDRDLAYGPGDRQRLDLFLVDDRCAPTCLFLHGGYWQWNDKEGQAFVAEGLMALGLSVAIGEVSLAPGATMDQICNEGRRQVAFLCEELSRRGRNGSVLLTGISSGAHVVACALGCPGVAGALLISGIYDLEPIRLSSLNDVIAMNAAMARRNSPLHQIPDALPDIVLAFGADERPEIRRQSTDYHAALGARGHSVELMPLEGEDHFSVLESLATPTGLLAQRLMSLARSCEPTAKT